MGEKSSLEPTPESQSSEALKGTMHTKVLHGGSQGFKSSKRRATMITKLNGNALTTLNLFVESSDVSKITEAEPHGTFAHREMENQAGNKGKAVVSDVDHGPMLGLSIDISCCKINKQSLPIKRTHIQAERCEVGTNAGHITLDMNVKAVANEREDDIICHPDVFQGGMEVDLAACMRFESDTEDISMFPDMNLPSNVDKQSTNLSHGVHRDTPELLKGQEELQQKGEKASSTNTITTHQPKLALDLNKEHIEITTLNEGDMFKDPHLSRQSASILGKRNWERTEDIITPPRRKERHNVSRSQSNNQNKQQIWIERWYSARTRNGGGGGLSGQAHVLFDAVKEKDSLRYLALGVKQFKDGDVCRIFAAGTTDVIPTSGRPGQGLDAGCQMSYNMKGLPSAAAMAIVGTAARQLCDAQSQKKKSFSFWSGFGSKGRSKNEISDHP